MGAGNARGLVRQGDVLLVPVDELPDAERAAGRGGPALRPRRGRGDRARARRARADARLVRSTTASWRGREAQLHLVVEERGERSSTTSTIRSTLAPGAYRVRRQREYAARPDAAAARSAGWRTDARPSRDRGAGARAPRGHRPRAPARGRGAWRPQRLQAYVQALGLPHRACAGAPDVRARRATHASTRRRTAARGRLQPARQYWLLDGELAGWRWDAERPGASHVPARGLPRAARRARARRIARCSGRARHAPATSAACAG